MTLQKELQFYRDKVRQIESLMLSALETPLTTAMPSLSGKMDTTRTITHSLLGPISKKRQLRTVCNLAFEEIGHAFHSHYGQLGAILGYGFLYGKEEHQQAVKSAVSEAVEIVAENRGLSSAVKLAFTQGVKQKQEAARRDPDWVQVYVKLEIA